MYRQPTKPTLELDIKLFAKGRVSFGTSFPLFKKELLESARCKAGTFWTTSACVFSGVCKREKGQNMNYRLGFREITSM